MKSVLFASLLVLLPSLALAQTYTTSSKFEWSAPSNAMDIADAQQFVYKLYVDGKPNADLVGHACIAPIPGDSVATCSVNVPAALLPTVNKRKVSLNLTARDPEPGSPETGLSPTLRIVRPPNAPGRLGAAQ